MTRRALVVLLAVLSVILLVLAFIARRRKPAAFGPLCLGASLAGAGASLVGATS